VRTSFTAHDLSCALSVIREIGQGCPTPGEFARRGVRLLPSFVDSEITTLSLCDLVRGRRRVVSNPAAAFGRHAMDAFDRHFFEHPLVCYHSEHVDGGVHRITDSVSHADFRRTPLYADYYAAVGLDHVLSLPLHADGRLIVAFVLNRTRRDFSERERDLLEIVRPHLATLYRQSYSLAEAQRALAASGEPSPLWRGTTDTMAGLTPREREVLGWVAAGKTNAQIAAILGAMPRTVAKHLERIFEKLGVETRTAAAMRVLNRTGNAATKPALSD
jgi:DNA-binding CsgD family transcriptional regulator